MNARARHATAAWAALLVAAAPAAAQPAASSAAPSQQEAMAQRGFIRHAGRWRTAQEIEIIERTERAHTAHREWKQRLERLRQRVDSRDQGDRAAEEIREISDPAALPALADALEREAVQRVRGWYVEALGRIGSPEALGVLVRVALDHPDGETRIAAIERLAALGPQAAVPTLVSALGSADNGQVNRAAEALGRLGATAAVGPLIAALETQHVVVSGGDTPAGATSATFTPTGGGLAMGGGPKQTRVPRRNDRVLEALVRLTGTNFEWDVQAWRAWFLNRAAPPADLDLRRG